MLPPRTVLIDLEEVIKYNAKNNKKHNTNNIFKYAPFIIKEGGDKEDTQKIVVLDYHFYYSEVEESWFLEELEKLFKVEIGQKNEKIVYGDTMEEGDEPCEDFFLIYRLHLTWHNADKWWNILEDPKDFIIIDKKYKDTLKELSNNLILMSNKVVTDEDLVNLGSFAKDLEEAISKIITKENGCFVKSSQHSTKHDFPPQEVFNASEAIQHLFSSMTIGADLSSKHDMTYGILVKRWDPRISKDNEFRLFIENNKVIGVSQQSLYNYCPRMMYVWKHMPDQIFESFQKLWDSVYEKLGNKYKYKNVSADAWLDDNYVGHLIEINGIGLWGPAGSSLFEWEHDPPRANDPQLRISA